VDVRNKLNEVLVAALVVTCSLLPHAVAGQTASAGEAPRTWNTVAGYLGIENLQCDCTLAMGSEGVSRRFVFRSEPVVTGVADGSPADGILERGDVISRIDGISLLTLEGARRFAAIAPGDDVHLTINRDGRAMQVSLRAEQSMNRVMYGVMAPSARPGRAAIAWTVPPEPSIPSQPAVPPAVVWATPRAAPAAPAAPAAQAPPVPFAVIATPAIPAVPESPASPQAWFGFSIRCNDCGWASSPGRDPVWESDETPEIWMIASDGPAKRAGLQPGDRIIAIDGYSILSRQGARRFGSVRPGKTIHLTIKRGNATMIKVLRPVRRPEVVAAIAASVPRAPRAPLAPSTRRELRYTGKMDNVSVQVWSAGGPTVERVGDEMVITVAGSVVRIKVDPRK
jgi:membrane-associated protease RseP (regulator of RpoE activity)